MIVVVVIVVVVVEVVLEYNNILRLQYTSVTVITIYSHIELIVIEVVVVKGKVWFIFTNSTNTASLVLV